MHNRNTFGTSNRFALAAALALAIVALLLTSPGISTASLPSTAVDVSAITTAMNTATLTPATTASAHAPIAFAPKPSLVDDICDAIEELIATLLAGYEFVEESEKPFPGTNPMTKEQIDLILDDLEGILAPIQTPNVYPDLTPPDAGMPGVMCDEWDPADCFHPCISMAEEALAEMQSQSPDHAYIGFRLDSIKKTIDRMRDAWDL